MRQTDVSCTRCGAGFRRLELVLLPINGDEFRCQVCGEVLEILNGDGVFVAYRLTVSPQIKGPALRLRRASYERLAQRGPGARQ